MAGNMTINNAKLLSVGLAVVACSITAGAPLSFASPKLASSTVAQVHESCPEQILYTCRWMIAHGQLDQAHRILASLAAKYPQDPQVFDALGQCEVQLDNMKDARNRRLHNLAEHATGSGPSLVHASGMLLEESSNGKSPGRLQRAYSFVSG
jgi:predicted Zn-dependent protease